MRITTAASSRRNLRSACYASRAPTRSKCERSAVATSSASSSISSQSGYRPHRLDSQRRGRGCSARDDKHRRLRRRRSHSRNLARISASPPISPAPQSAGTKGAAFEAAASDAPCRFSKVLSLNMSCSRDRPKGHRQSSAWRRELETPHRVARTSSPRGYCIRLTPGLMRAQQSRLSRGRLPPMRSRRF
jgi:hypothetical protein